MSEGDRLAVYSSDLLLQTSTHALRIVLCMLNILSCFTVFPESVYESVENTVLNDRTVKRFQGFRTLGFRSTRCFGDIELEGHYKHGPLCMDSKDNAYKHVAR